MLAIILAHGLAPVAGPIVDERDFWVALLLVQMVLAPVVAWLIASDR